MARKKKSDRPALRRYADETVQEWEFRVRQADLAGKKGRDVKPDETSDWYEDDKSEYPDWS